MRVIKKIFLLFFLLSNFSLPLFALQDLVNGLILECDLNILKAEDDFNFEFYIDSESRGANEFIITIEVADAVTKKPLSPDYGNSEITFVVKKDFERYKPYTIIFPLGQYLKKKPDHDLIVTYFNIDQVFFDEDHIYYDHYANARDTGHEFDVKDIEPYDPYLDYKPIVIDFMGWNFFDLYSSLDCVKSDESSESLSYKAEIPAACLCQSRRSQTGFIVNEYSVRLDTRLYTSQIHPSACLFEIYGPVENYKIWEKEALSKFKRNVDSSKDYYIVNNGIAENAYKIQNFTCSSSWKCRLEMVKRGETQTEYAKISFIRVETPLLYDFSVLDYPLTQGFLDKLDSTQLRILRNAIYARHGRPFKDENLQDLFYGKNDGESIFYKVTAGFTQNEKYSDKLLSDLDKENIKMIQKEEDKRSK